jgi:predicted CXXCH cytochrome family protein
MRSNPRATRRGEGKKAAGALALAACALAAALACAPRPPGAATPAPAPEKKLFEPYPPEQVAGVRDPHDYGGKALCQRCHTTRGGLLGDPDGLCGECHSFHHTGRTHPVGVVQKTPVDLPLRQGGKVACFTCHDPHQGKQVLRKRFDDLCMTCHKAH